MSLALAQYGPMVVYGVITFAAGACFGWAGSSGYFYLTTRRKRDSRGRFMKQHAK